MTDKTISSYQAGEYLQFQKDVVPEVTQSYTIGTRTAPFYALYATRIPLTHLQQLTTADYTTTPYNRGSLFFDPATNRMVLFRTTTQRAQTGAFPSF